MIHRSNTHIAPALDFAFGCHHSVRRVVSAPGGRSHGVCCACGAKLHKPTPKIVDKFRQWQQIWLNVIFLLKGAFHAA